MHFTAIGNDKAKCDHCGHELSYRGSTSNLRNHYQNKRFVFGSLATQKSPRMSSVRVQDSPSNDDPTARCNSGSVAPGSSTEKSQSINPELVGANARKSDFANESMKQSPLSSFVVRPTSVVRQKRLKKALLDMIVTDVQPFAVVKNQGFRHFLSSVNPSYKLPSRATIAQELLPTAYQKAVEEVKPLSKGAKSICLTTDSWTSVTTESYLAVTAHFFNNEFRLESCLLGCFKFGQRHTAENLKDKLLHIISEWDNQEKIVLVVTDNAANMTSAVKNAGFKHLPCFAHTLNLVVQKRVLEIKQLQQKVKTIVEYFRRSTVAAEKFASLQLQINSGEPARKLKNDVITRWNSTYDMLRRFSLLQEPLEAVLGVPYNPVPNLTSEEWLVLREICAVLKLFEQVTKKYVRKKISQYPR